MASRSVKLDEPPDDAASWTMVDIQLDLSTAVDKAGWATENAPRAPYPPSFIGHRGLRGKQRSRGTVDRIAQVR